jgi:hypothetical protein
MKKKTRRQLKKSVRQLSRVLGVEDAPGAALGALALGGLLATLAKDEEIRAQMRTLAGTTLRRIVSVVTGDREDRRGDEPHHDRELKHAH